jgi:hypothetical protein
VIHAAEPRAAADRTLAVLALRPLSETLCAPYERTGATNMERAPASLLAEVVACRHIVDDYAGRLDAACVEHYETGKSLFPHLSRAEDEDTQQRCERVLKNVASVSPDALNDWQAIKYDARKEQIVGMRDLWVRRRNLFRALERNLKARLELHDTSRVEGNRRTPMNEPNSTAF